MKDVNLLAKRIGLVAVANLVSELYGLILLPILVKNMSISEYGVWVQIYVTVGLIPALALLGLQYSMVRFLAPARNREEAAQIFYPIAAAMSLCGIFSSAAIYIFAQPLSRVLFGGDIVAVKILSSIIFFECILQITMNYFRSTQQIKKHSLFLSSRSIIIIISIGYLVTAGYGITGALVGMLAATSLVACITAMIVINEIGITYPRFDRIREYLSFGFPTVPGNLSGWAVSYSDRYVITILLGTAAVGYYSPGYTLGNIINIFVTPLSFLLPSALSRLYDNDEKESVIRIIGYSMRLFLTLAIPSAFGISVLSRPILEILATPEIAKEGFLVTPFVALSAIFIGGYAILSQRLILEKKTKAMGTILILTAALNLGSTIIAVPIMGITGAALTTLLAYAFAYIVACHVIETEIDIQLDRAFIVKCTISALIMSGFLMATRPVSAQGILGAIIISAIIYLISLFAIGGISKEEILFLKQLAR